MIDKLVSVVIPVFNQEQYLRKSIPSVLAQTYSNLEIICVNDGSTDKSRDILEEYSRADLRIKIIDKENGGLVDAILVGIQSITGEYVCFLDSDDYLGDNYIKYFVDNIGNFDFIAAGHYLDNNGQLTKNLVIDERDYAESDFVYFRKNLIWDSCKHTLSKQFLNSRWNKLYKTNCVKKIAKQYELCKGISFGEDTMFTYLLLCNAKSGRTIKTTNTYYYNTGNQNSMMSSEKIDIHLKKANDALRVLKVLYEKNGDDETGTLTMYYFLVESIFQRLEYGSDEEEFGRLYDKLKKDEAYRDALNYLIRNSKGKRRLVLLLRRAIKNPKIYKKLFLLNSRLRGLAYKIVWSTAKESELLKQHMEEPSYMDNSL